MYKLNRNGYVFIPKDLNRNVQSTKIVIAKSWKQDKQPRKVEWIKCHIFITEIVYSNGVNYCYIQHADGCHIRLNKRSQPQKSMCCIIPFM